MDVQRQDAEQQVGLRTAEKDKAVGIANEQANQEIQAQAKTTAEKEFLALGEGARLWLIEAAAAGTVRVRVKMAAAVELARLFTPGEVDWALGHAAVHGRFAEADLASILDHHQQARGPEHRAGENASLTQGTHGWSRYGTSEEVNQ